MIFRAHPQPRNYLPLSVRSVGRYSVNAQWQERSQPKWFTQIFWTFEGTGCFVANGKPVTARAGDIFIYRPGDAHELQTQGRQWGYCWITLDHPQSAAWVEGFGLAQHSHAPRPCPQHLFRKIRTALETGTEQGEHKAAHYAHALLIAAAPKPEPLAQAPLAAAAKAMIDGSFADPNLNVQAIADSLGIHRSTLFRHFVALYGLTPVQYLGNLRLQRAIGLINSNQSAITDIARRTGFSDPNYLSRRISERTGMPARKIRQGHN